MTFDEWLIDRLRTAGAYAGTMDGVHGREVIAALERFQRANSLKVTGKADAATVAELRVVKRSGDSGVKTYDKAPELPKEPVWMREARRFVGQKEIPGPKSNPVIMGWAKRFGGWIANYFSDDDIPWCGLFIGHVIATTLPKEPLPANPLGALQWRKFGKETPASLGAILVFSRSGGGHVGIYVGEDKSHYHVLGGNQSNMVNVTRIDKSRLVAGGIRWPKTGEAPIGGKVTLSTSGVPVSTNEA